jgi:hypothetical protein
MLSYVQVNFRNGSKGELSEMTASGAERSVRFDQAASVPECGRDPLPAIVVSFG